MVKIGNSIQIPTFKIQNLRELFPVWLFPSIKHSQRTNKVKQTITFVWSVNKIERNLSSKSTMSSLVPYNWSPEQQLTNWTFSVNRNVPKTYLVNLLRKQSKQYQTSRMTRNEVCDPIDFISETVEKNAYSCFVLGECYQIQAGTTTTITFYTPFFSLSRLFWSMCSVI